MLANAVVDGLVAGLEVQNETKEMLQVVDLICHADPWSDEKTDAFRQLSFDLHPGQLHFEARCFFVSCAIEKGVVEAAVRVIEHGVMAAATAASNFLGDFCFNSDPASQAVLKVFDRIVERLKLIFDSKVWKQQLALLEAAVILCVNIAAACPSEHLKLIPFVRPVCLQIIQDFSSLSSRLRGNTILLLANLSLTVRHELRSLNVGDVLLDLVQGNSVGDTGKSVAESVITFLHGDNPCEQMDCLVDTGVVGDYCVPIMQSTMRGAEFRGMYPHLLYSARLFQILAKTRKYAETLVADPRVLPLLLQATNPRYPVRMASDITGRRFALEALWSLARFGLWPCATMDEKSEAFIKCDLPILLADDHLEIRTAAAGLWACIHKPHVNMLLLTGGRLASEGTTIAELWYHNILPGVFPLRPFF